MDDEEKMAIKVRLRNELEAIRVDLRKKDDEDCTDLVHRIGNVGYSLFMELGSDPGGDPTPSDDERPKDRKGGCTKAYAEHYLQEVQARLDLL